MTTNTDNKDMTKTNPPPYLEFDYKTLYEEQLRIVDSLNKLYRQAEDENVTLTAEVAKLKAERAEAPKVEEDCCNEAPLCHLCHESTNGDSRCAICGKPTCLDCTDTEELWESCTTCAAGLRKEEEVKAEPKLQKPKPITKDVRAWCRKKYGNEWHKEDKDARKGEAKKALRKT